MQLINSWLMLEVEAYLEVALYLERRHVHFEDGRRVDSFDHSCQYLTGIRPFPHSGSQQERCFWVNLGTHPKKHMHTLHTLPLAQNNVYHILNPRPRVSVKESDLVTNNHVEADKVPNVVLR